MELVHYIFLAIGLSFVVIFTITFSKALIESKKNNKQPITSKHVKVVTKCNIANANPNAGAFILFEFDDGSRKKLTVAGSTAFTIAESDTGMLTYQGTRFLKFERHS